MRKILAILLFIPLTLWGQDIGGDYYISPTGSYTGDGSYADPFVHLQQAINVATAGDTIYIRGGTYVIDSSFYGNNICVLNPSGSIGDSGTYEAPICYFNYPGESPVFDYSQIASAGDFNTGLNALGGARHIRFRGLEMKNLLQQGKDGHDDTMTVCMFNVQYGKNWHFENISIHDCGGRGYYYENSAAYNDSVQWINCDVYNCADTFNVQPGNLADGWKCHGYINGHFIWRGCRSWHNSDDGFDLSGNSVGEWHNCWAYDMGYLDTGDGDGFKVGAVSDSMDYPSRILVNCIAAECFNHDSSDAGFHELDYYLYNGPPDYDYFRVNGRFYNCFSYNNAYGFSADWNEYKPWRNTIYRNNVSYSNRRVLSCGGLANIAIINATYPESHNSWDVIDPSPASCPPWFVETDSVTITDDDFVSLDASQLTSSRQLDGSLPVITFGHLREDSDLIDAGTVIPESDNSGITLSYYGSAPDIGAFEWRNTYKPKPAISGGKAHIVNGKIQIFKP